MLIFLGQALLHLSCIVVGSWSGVCACVCGSSARPIVSNWESGFLVFEFSAFYKDKARLRCALEKKKGTYNLFLNYLCTTEGVSKSTTTNSTSSNKTGKKKHPYIKPDMANLNLKTTTVIGTVINLNHLFIASFEQSYYYFRCKKTE